jgi:hypothetical protein
LSPDASELPSIERFLAMYARAVENAESRLRELRNEQWLDLSLAALVTGIALAATGVRPALAIPLFLGGLYAWALGIRALVRHWDLLDRLAGERDAHVIPAVAAYAARHATLATRDSLAAGIIRGMTTTYRLSSGDRLIELREAFTAQQALFDYLRSLGCQDEEIMKLSDDVVSWRGAVYRAVPVSSDPNERGHSG